MWKKMTMTPIHFQHIFIEAILLHDSQWKICIYSWRCTVALFKAASVLHLFGKHLNPLKYFSCYSTGVSININGSAAFQWDDMYRHKGPETKAAKWYSAIIHFVINTPAFSTVTCQNVLCEKAYRVHYHLKQSNFYCSNSNLTFFNLVLGIVDINMLLVNLWWLGLQSQFTPLILPFLLVSHCQCLPVLFLCFLGYNLIN